MAEYVLGHHLEGEGKRLALMSQLLDPMHRRHIESLNIEPGARTLEVGCGNGSISAWLAARVAPGEAVACDLDLSLINVCAPGLQLRQGDIMAGPIEPASFDLVTARALLHHVADAETAIVNLVASLRPGGVVLLIEPDFLPITIAEPPEARARDFLGARVRQQIFSAAIVCPDPSAPINFMEKPVHDHEQHDHGEEAGCRL
jgi:ubiquinone/menaquinone biosynthesis C-methylase UbiE